MPIDDLTALGQKMREARKKKDLRIILNDFNLVLNDGDKAVIIGEEGNGKSTLMKWIYKIINGIFI